MLLSDDGLAHLVRQEALYRSLTHALILPRWAPDLNFGLGSPVFLYNWLLPYYIGGLGRLAGLSEVTAFKFTLGLGMTLSALFCYLWLKTLRSGRGTSRIAVLTGTILYTLVPYRVMTAYERGTPGETWLAVFPPLILWLNKARPLRGVPFLLPLAWAGMFLTHSVGGMIITPAILLLSCFNSEGIKVFKATAIPILIGLLLAAFNWLPAALEAPQVTNVGSYFLETAPHLHAQFASESLRSGILGDPLLGLTSGPKSLAVGFAIPVILLLALGSFGKLGRLGKISLFSIGLCFILMSPWAAPVWQLPLLNSVLYPWRLVQVVILLATYLASWFIAYHSGKKGTFIAAFFIMLAILGTFFSLATKPRFAALPPGWFETTPPDVIGEYLPKGLTREQLETLRHTLPTLQGVTTYDQLYFPGWKAYAWKVELPINSHYPGREGLITVEVPASVPVEFRFIETSMRRVGILMTFIGIVGWAFSIKKFLLKIT